MLDITYLAYLLRSSTFSFDIYILGIFLEELYFLFWYQHAWHIYWGALLSLWISTYFAYFLRSSTFSFGYLHTWYIYWGVLLPLWKSTYLAYLLRSSTFSFAIWSLLILPSIKSCACFLSWNVDVFFRGWSGGFMSRWRYDPEGCRSLLSYLLDRSNGLSQILSCMDRKRGTYIK